MSLPLDILDNLRGFSKAMYSTWFYYAPAGIMFDSGEGAATRLANTVFGVKSVFLSHGHHDHIGGLPGIVLARNSAMGEKTLPLEIHHPQGDSYVQLQREYILHLSRGLEYDLTWKSMSPGESVDLKAASGKWRIVSFKTKHVKNQTTLGYKLVETRKRLKPEFKGMGEADIAAAAARLGRDAVSETYDHVLLAYGGDSMALDPADVAGAELLLHDATFIGNADREFDIHATMEEALRVSAEAGVRIAGLMHISSRYNAREIEEKAREAAAPYAGSMKVAVFHNSKVILV